MAASRFETLALPRICAYAAVNNIGSRRILAKIGLWEGSAFVENGTACVWYEADNHTQRAPKTDSPATLHP